MKTACINCGAEVDDTATFCIECGSRLSPLGGPSTPPASSDASSRNWRKLYPAKNGGRRPNVYVTEKKHRSKEKSKKRDNMILIICGVITIVLTLFIGNIDESQGVSPDIWEIFWLILGFACVFYGLLRITYKK